MSALSEGRASSSRIGGFGLCLALAAGCSSTGSWGSTVPAERSHEVRESLFDVEHYALEIELDPAARRIAGRARIRVGPRSRPVKEIELDFVDLDVRSVEGERGEPLEFIHEDGLLTIQLARGLRLGDFTEFTVIYDGVPRRGLYFNDFENGAATQVFTQGECEESRGWFPCFDRPDDRATSEVAVIMPAKWTSVAAGERVERRELAKDRALERWRMSTPHPAYLTTLVAGDFSTQTAEWDGIPLVYLADPKLEPFMSARFAQTPKVLEFLSRLTGVRYPYAKYSQAAVANFQFGGMENISATTLTDTWLTDERGDRDNPAGGLIAHEAAHQWFGDLLTCRDWSHIWLNEGWATYANELYVESSMGREAFEVSMAATRDGYLNLDLGPARRPMVHDVYRDPMDLFVTGHAYPGGASRLHQLRFELGDETFFAGVRRYFTEHRGTAVTTEDFQHSMEAASGRDLSKFFRQWFYSKGYPEFAMSWDWDESAHKLVVLVEQIQSVADGTPEVFRTPAEIEIMPSRGESAEPKLERIAIDKRKSSFSFDAPLRPRWVVFDP
ncbi:MAG: M1 family metallopeptidase, partial [Planctomycetota bacterium]